MLAAYLGDTETPEANQDLMQQAAAQNLWNTAIATLDYAVPRLSSMQEQIAQLKAEGKWSGRMDKSVKVFAKETQKLLGEVSKAVNNSPPAQSIMDEFLAAVNGVNTVIKGAWHEIIAQIQPTGPQMAGLGFIGPVLQVIKNPAVWKGAAEILKKLGPYVATYLIGDQIVKVSDNVADTMGSSSKKVQESGKLLEQCLAALSNAKSLEERSSAEALCANVMPQSNILPWLVVGGIAAGAGYLYWKNKNRFRVQSPVRFEGMGRRRS